MCAHIIKMDMVVIFMVSEHIHISFSMRDIAFFFFLLFFHLFFERISLKIIVTVWHLMPTK